MTDALRAERAPMASGRWHGWVSAGLLVLAAYVPLLAARPGRMVADTKLYLYLDPGRLIESARWTWDSSQFGGGVPHQIVAYLWPQGPWYWLFDHLGTPDWVAHRLWVGTLFAVGGLGVRWAAKHVGLALPAATIAALAYQASPYVLPYASRTSAMLLPWAALGWIVGHSSRGLVTGRRWRHAAAIALIVASCGAVNATALLMVVPAPVLVIVDDVLRRTTSWRTAAGFASRVALLCTATSLWWVEMVRLQGIHGADLLQYSESLEATSLTTSSTEVLRGMGYWLFYVRDAFAFTTTASETFMTSPWVIAAGMALLCLSLAGLAVVRWEYRRLAALLLFAGTLLAVGAHPIDDPALIMRPLAENSRSTLSLALRSSARAVPLVVFALSLGLAALVTVVSRRMAAGRSSGRSRRIAGGIPIALAVVLIAVANPALADTSVVDPALERDQQPPAAWTDAAAFLDATGTEARVLQLPGAEFGAFDWGYTVDPPLPGLTSKPLITRDLLPLGSAALLDLAYSLDDRAQAGTLEASSVAPVARVLGVDVIWLPGDLSFERFRNPWPATVMQLLEGAPDIEAAGDFGAAGPAMPSVPMLDERMYSTSSPESVAVAPVELFRVLDAVQVARTATRVVVIAGSGDGVIDAAAAGLIHGDEALVYAGHLADGSIVPVGDVALVIITDSNRDRAHHWRSSQDVTGFTERGGPSGDLLGDDGEDPPLPVFGSSPDPEQQTVTLLDRGLDVRATAYGEPFAYRPEHRPAMAVDGSATTSWIVGERGDPVGEAIRVSSTDGYLSLVQPQDPAATRTISAVIITEDGQPPRTVELGAASMLPPGQRIDLAGRGPVTGEIAGVAARPAGSDSGPTGVGFAELGVPAAAEWVRMPRLPDVGVDDVPVAIVLTRLRVDPLNRWREDPEAQLRRIIEVRGGRLDLTATLRLSARAADRVLAQVTGIDGASADSRLHGDPRAIGAAAVDGRLDTAWTTPFASVIGSSVTADIIAPVTTLSLVQRTGERYSTITGLSIADRNGIVQVEVPPPDADGRSTIVLPREMTGRRLSLTIDAIDERRTVDRRYGELVVLPASIAEIESPSLRGATTVPPKGGCRRDLVSIDGVPVGLEVTAADLAALAEGEAVDVSTCDALVLDDGEHRVESALGSDTGIDVDRVMMSTGRPRDAEDEGNTSMPVQVTGTSTARTLEVPACPTGCWLVWGEG
ncbi:MAG: alpha-(1-_3)-arabinofuranosyltransferase family protein, partial [Ilumatobacteraceae bacterium]